MTTWPIFLGQVALTTHISWVCGRWWNSVLKCRMIIYFHFSPISIYIRSYHLWPTFFRRKKNEEGISTTAALPPKQSSRSPPDQAWAMAGPAQNTVLRLKVVKRSEAQARGALRAMGFSRSRISQLMADCEQFPPKSWVQRRGQTAQDQPQCLRNPFMMTDWIK